MTDLTEQWKKGELPEGDYFISYEDEIYPDYYDRAEGFLKTYDYGVRRVLAPVPSYEEWQAKLEENSQLKELLKECRPYFDALVEKRLKLEYIPQVYELLTKINEVLK